MRHDWRQIPALLAGAGVLAATLYTVQSAGRADLAPERSAEQAATIPPTAMRVATPPSEVVARAVERAARGALPEPYFADRPEAARFLSRWQGRLVEGRALVAQADQFDVGAEHGHRVPITLWLDSGSRVMGLSGEAAFEPGPEGLRLQTLQLEQIPLALNTWAEAAWRVRQAHPAQGEPVGATAPFHGLFRFRLGSDGYAVDARTGEMIVE